MGSRYSVTDAEIVSAIREHGSHLTAWNLSRQLHVGENRLTRIADEFGLSMADKRTPPKAGKIKWDEHAYATKLCPHCDQWLGIEYFHESNSSANGYESWCRHCRLTAINERNRKKRHGG